MNNVEEIRFLHRPVKVSRSGEGDIDKICINDVCAVLKRSLFLKDGTALRKCPSGMILDETQPKEIFADFGEVVGLIKWIATGSKVLEPTCRELLELLQQSRIVPVAALAQSPQIESADEPTVPEAIVLEYSGSKFTMKMNDGRYMVNATEMARPFDKRPTVWLKLAETVKLRQALVDDGIFTTTESQVITARGPHGATWLEIHLWVQFAQWLSPAFAAWCSKKMVPLMQNGHVDMSEEDESYNSRQNRKPRFDDLDFTENYFLPVPSTYEEALTVIETQKTTIGRQREFITQNKHKVEHYDSTVDEREWFSTTMIANELGVSAIKLNIFLMDEGMQNKISDEWVITQQYRHLRGIHIYEWFNHKTKYVNKYKIDSWTPEGREYIIDLWKKENG